MTNKFNTYYFAYGSNLDIKRLKERGVNFSKRIPAVMEGYKLVFDKIDDGNPRETKANIQPEKNSIVEGAVYLVTSESLPNLDRFEGFPRHYGKTEMEVTIKSTSEKVKVWVYIARPEKIGKGKPTKDYLEHILKGKDLFSEEYYQNLQKVEIF